MNKVPDVMFVIDTHMEQIAVLEGRRMGIPVVGIVDTNSDPALVDYAIPANDDAVGSLTLIVRHIIDAWIEGKTKKGAEEPKVVKEAGKKKAEVKAEPKEKKTRKKETENK